MTKTNRGFVLITFVGLFMASFAVIWLMHLKAVHEQQLEFTDRYQYQLHQTRVQLFGLAQQKPSTQSWLAWQLSPQLRQWQEQLANQGLAVRVEIHPLALVVNMSSHQMVNRLSERLVHSVREGTELKLLLPLEQGQHSNEQWLSRQSVGQLTMATDLFGTHSAIKNISTLSGQRSHLDHLLAHTVNTEQLNATAMHVDELRLAAAVQLESLTATHVLSEQAVVSTAAINIATVGTGQATTAVIEHANSLQTIATTHTGIQLQAERVGVSQSVQLQGHGQDRLDTVQRELGELEQLIYNCIDETQWCLAAERPTFTVTSCQGCELEQQSRHFEAIITIDVDFCIHGCGIRTSNPIGVAVHCPHSQVPAQQSGGLQCHLTATLADTDELSYNLQVQVFSQKNISVFKQIVVPIQWRVNIPTCAHSNHSVTVDYSVPTMNYTLILPEYAGGQLFTWSDRIYQECRASRPASFINCDLFATCTVTGEWQDIEARCSCEGW